MPDLLPNWAVRVDVTRRGTCMHVTRIEALSKCVRPRFVFGDLSLCAVAKTRQLTTSATTATTNNRTRDRADRSL